MKFPRNARMLKGHLDFAPFAGVFFCLLIFVLLSSLVYTPGVHLQLPPPSSYQTGVAGLPVAVALDPAGHLYYQNQLVTEQKLKARLEEKVHAASPEPVTLVLQADKNVTIERRSQVLQLARDAGITNAVEQTAPGIFEVPAGK
jgi:biopolymer transport protein ExbD